MFQKLSISLFLGFLYLFISISLFNSGNSFIQYALFLLAPLPIFLVVLYFPFWIAFIAFIPITFLLFINFNYAVIINSVLTIPLLLIFLFINIKHNNIGKYIPIIIILYALLFFLIISFYFITQNFITLPDFILDTVNIIILHLNSLHPSLVKEYDLKTLMKYFAFLFPTLVVLLFYLILTTNYLIANWIINNNTPKFNKFKIGSRLPSIYIYIYVCVLISTIVVRYTIKNNWNISYIMHNISLFLFIPFLISGLGVVNYMVSKNKFYLFLFIILIFFSNLYIIVILCLLGFLKEAKIILYNKKNYTK